MSQPDFSLFVSSVPDRTVYRYGTRQLLGAKRTLVNGEVVTTWDPANVIPIPRAEAERYLKEYARDIRDGSLKQRERAEWEAQQAATLKAEAAAREAAQKTAEAAPQPDPQTP